MKDIYSAILNFIDASYDSEEKFETLVNTFEKQKVLKNKGDVILLFQLISKISDNHHQSADFYDKLEKIFRYLINDTPSFISNFIPDYSKFNKRILFFLLEKKLIKPDKSFLKQYLCDKHQSFYYLYPKMKEFLEEEKQKQMLIEIQQKYNEDISTFEDKCKIGENDLYICSLIRSDSIEKFVSYVNRTNLSLSTKIKPSIYETNLFLIDKEPTLIEYAAFFGSIQIIQYLKYNKVPLTFSLWFYAIHSNSPDLIHFLEENGVKPEKNTQKIYQGLNFDLNYESIDVVLIESIKCHHNSISNYIKDNLYERVQTEDYFYDNFSDIILNSMNFFFFPSETESRNKERFDLFQLRFLLTQITIPSSMTSIGFAAYYGYLLLSQISFDFSSSVVSIGNLAFYGCSSLTQISIPSSVTSIGDYAFCRCSSLMQITIPFSITSIGIAAFYDCSSLTQVSFEIPSSLISIGNYAFSGCTSLTKISIPSTVTSFGNYIFYGCSSLKHKMNYIDIAKRLIGNVSDEGKIEDGMSNQLFSSFNDSNIWSPFDIDCAMPESSFYIAKLNSNLSPINVDAIDDNIYLIIRHSKDDITKYLEYLKFEYNSYMKMEKQMNEIIAPIGYTQNISQQGFLFAFLTSTNITLSKVIDSIKDIPLENKFKYAINLINVVNESLSKESLSGFHISLKTILINLQKDEAFLGFIGFIGGIENLKLCPTANKFIYNKKFSPSELKIGIKPKIRAPNSFSDVYGLAKVIQFMIGDCLKNHSYRRIMTSALQKNPNDRISLNDFKSKMIDIQIEVFTLKDKMHTPLFMPQYRLADIIKEQCITIKTEEGCPQIYKLPSYITYIDPSRKLRKITVGHQINSFKEEVTILIVGICGSGKTTFLNGVANYLYGVKWEDDFRFKVVSSEDNDEINDPSKNQTTSVTAYTFYWQPGFPISYTVTLIDTPGFGNIRGIEADMNTINQIKSFFTDKSCCGIDSLNAVAFINKSDMVRYFSSKQFMVDSILKLFGKDIFDNFIIIATFADAGEPRVLETLRSRGIPTTYCCKFNNYACFKKSTWYDYPFELFWKIGQVGYEDLFKYISKMKPKSLK